MPLNMTYLHQLQAYRRLAAWADRHEKVIRFLIIVEVAVFGWHVFWNV